MQKRISSVASIIKDAKEVHVDIAKKTITLEFLKEKGHKVEAINEEFINSLIK